MRSVARNEMVQKVAGEREEGITTEDTESTEEGKKERRKETKRKDYRRRNGE
jgi:hypothetical protein